MHFTYISMLGLYTYKYIFTFASMALNSQLELRHNFTDVAVGPSGECSVCFLSYHAAKAI